MKQAYAIGLRGNDERVVQGQTEVIEELFGGLKTPEEEEAELRIKTSPKAKGAGTKRKTEVSLKEGNLDGWAHKKSKAA